VIASRSPIVHLGVRAASPLALVVGLHLLLAGHNNPGGGFAAGLVVGAVVIPRAVAGLQRPGQATGIIAAGVLLVVATAAAPLLWGDLLLDQQVVLVELPLVGEVKSGSALPFDIGVATIVVGLVIASLDGLMVTALDDGDRPPNGTGWHR
jgi:multisubunit Na+/H+ antiporter MnhB subunit